MSSVLHNDIDIVCLSLSRWDAPISSPAVALAREFSKNNRVFFIEHPYSWKDLATKRKLPGRAPYRDGNVTVIAPPLILPINFLPEGWLYDRLSSFNNNIVLNTLRTVIREAGISKFIFINFFDPFFLADLSDDIRPLKYVYQCMDDLSEVAYTRRHAARLENDIVSKADITLCTSGALTKLKSAFSKNVHFHPNGADTALFQTAFGKSLPRPADLPVTGKKIIGFTGSIEYRTDYELLARIAKDHHVFLIGPVAGEEHQALRGIPNIIFAGAKKLSELPAYLTYFDCCIIPYKINKLTSSIYPLKINEYLAAGKPVVGTKFSEDIAGFSDVAYIAESHDEFLAMIDRAIDEDDINKKYQRLDVALSNSWEKRVEDFWKIVI